MRVTSCGLPALGGKVRTPDTPDREKIGGTGKRERERERDREREGQREEQSQSIRYLHTEARERPPLKGG
jgi:hypothetical protein